MGKIDTRMRPGARRQQADHRPADDGEREKQDEDIRETENQKTAGLIAQPVLLRIRRRPALLDIAQLKRKQGTESYRTVVIGEDYLREVRAEL